MTCCGVHIIEWRRLQHLERQYQQQFINLNDSEAELVRIVDWKQSSDAASDKVAEVLGALQLEQDDHRQVTAKSIIIMVVRIAPIKIAVLILTWKTFYW